MRYGRIGRPRTGLGIVAVGVGLVAARLLREGHRPSATTRAGRTALVLAGAGVVLVGVGIAGAALVHRSVGELHLPAAVALVGLVALAAAGVAAVVAIARARERSPWVLATLPLAALALVGLVVEIATGA